MDEHIGLQKQEIPKLSDQVRERIEVSEERRLDPQRLQVEDALTKLTELLDDWEAVWISPPWRSLVWSSSYHFSLNRDRVDRFRQSS